MNKPIILYVDDEPYNLTVFEAALPSDWEIKTFTSPVKALEALAQMTPHVVVSDQRMPETNGVTFLELTKKLHPHAIRILVTGYSDEDLVVESVRRAHVFDYIKKPWEPEELESSIKRALELYKASEQARDFFEQLQVREKNISDQNQNLLLKTNELETSRNKEIEIRKELECWVPRPLLRLLEDKTIQFPLIRDIVGIKFDIIGSSQIHNIKIRGKALRELLLRNFTECILRYGGWRENHAGDSAYGHFGIWDEVVNPFESALAAAQEFSIMLRNLCQIHSVQVECGISLHLAKNSTVHVHVVQIETPNGQVIQKSFDTDSIEVDLLHRIETLAHDLPGTNIILSAGFIEGLKNKSSKLIHLGLYLAKGQPYPVDLYLLPGELVTLEILESFKKKYFQTKDQAIDLAA